MTSSIFNVLLMEQDIFLFRTGIIDFLQQVNEYRMLFNQSQPSFYDIIMHAWTIKISISSIKGNSFVSKLAWTGSYIMIVISTNLGYLGF